ncbi:hypothetical protein JTB14_005777 [Gonioctena quinquepunctata]|nr:hypothetical protein JTB14_005777 [Gonioctena quinquepunctata]
MWCKAMKEKEFENEKPSAMSCLYCCEDHFDCQKENEPITVRQAALKRQRLSLVQDTLPQAATREVFAETKLSRGPADSTKS